MNVLRWFAALVVGVLSAGWIVPLWMAADGYLFFWQSPGMDLLFTGKTNYPGMGGGPAVIFMIEREHLLQAMVWLGIVVAFWATVAALALFARRARGNPG